MWSTPSFCRKKRRIYEDLPGGHCSRAGVSEDPKRDRQGDRLYGARCLPQLVEKLKNMPGIEGDSVDYK